MFAEVILRVGDTAVELTGSGILFLVFLTLLGLWLKKL